MRLPQHIGRQCAYLVTQFKHYHILLRMQEGVHFGNGQELRIVLLSREEKIGHYKER